KTGSIMKIAGALTTTSGAPPVSRVAATSDGRGVNALLFLGNDLYIAESGGAGLSLITDPSGRTRPPCSAAAPLHGLAGQSALRLLPRRPRHRRSFHLRRRIAGNRLRAHPEVQSGAAGRTRQSIALFRECAGICVRLR